MPDDLVTILKISPTNTKEELRDQYNRILGDGSKVLLIILGNGAENIERNARDTAANDEGTRRAVWIKSIEILADEELTQLTNSDSKNVVCSLSFERKAGSWLTAKKAKQLGNIERCFAEAQERDEQ